MRCCTRCKPCSPRWRNFTPRSTTSKRNASIGWAPRRAESPTSVRPRLWLRDRQGLQGPRHQRHQGSRQEPGVRYALLGRRGELNARVGSLARYEKNNRKAEPQPCLSESRAPRYPTGLLPTPGSDTSTTSTPTTASFHLRVLRFSVTNLDAGSIPNAPISIPNRGASSPIACRPYVDRSRRYIDRGWRIIPRAARYRSSKQCTDCQAADNAGCYVATPCNRRPGCTCKANTACD